MNKPEIDLPESVDIHDEQVYTKARENFVNMMEKGWLKQDSKPMLYIYKQKMGKVEQYGIVGCVSADEYNQDLIKKHEFTRKDKEDDRTKHVIVTNINAGPVFLTYRDQESINNIVADFVKNHKPENDFVKEDGIQHTVWLLDDQKLIDQLQDEFKKIPALYVADGHHRSASAARAKAEKMQNDPNPSSDKEYNYFLAVIFPASHLYIMDYNRVVFELNGNTQEQFMQKLQEKFEVIGENTQPDPKQRLEFGMYLGGKWYQIKAKDGSYPANDPVESLDCAILQNNLLRPVLGIDDPRTSKKIDFVGGIRGSKELEKRVNSGEAKVAFKLFPTSIHQLMSVADAGKVMPPKSTWFEPKLRSGLIVHSLEE